MNPSHGYALVTGAASGIGRGIATEFAAKKRPLVLVDINQKTLEELAVELARVHGVVVQVLATDLSELGAAGGIASKVQAQSWEVDTLVNCAGIGSSGEFSSLDPAR